MTEKDITICGHGSGKPSTKNMESFLSLRYSKKASNGVRKGIVAVKRHKKMNSDQKRKAFHDTYKTILGRNIYTQTFKRRYVYKAYTDGKYYSDCSSSGDGTFREIGIDVDWLNTAGIYNSKDFVTVPVIIKNGHITNPEILEVGDCLLFAGDDPKRPLQIGHVEYVYEIKGDKKPEPTPEKKTYSGTFPVIPPTLKKGSKGTEVNRLQKYLNWYGGYGLAVDSQFGNATQKAVKEFQKSSKVLYVDGEFGPKSLAYAKTVKK